MSTPKQYLIRLLELKTVVVEAPDIKEAARIAERLVKERALGSRLLDIHILETPDAA